MRVVGLLVRYTQGNVGTVAIDSDDIWPFLEQRVGSALVEGELLEAKFRLFHPGNPDGNLVWARMPNRLGYRKFDDALFRPYLEARGILAGGAQEVGE